MPNNSFPSSIFNSFPAWILDEDGEDGELRRLTQIMSSYFDTLRTKMGWSGNIR